MYFALSGNPVSVLASILNKELLISFEKARLCFEMKKYELATHCSQYSILLWKIPWAEEPGRLQSLGSLRVRHN